MFYIDEDLTIHITRGDAAVFRFSAVTDEEDTPYRFVDGDVVRFKVFGKKNCEETVLVKDFKIYEYQFDVDIELDSDDTKFGEYISKPTDYWYEIELNPDTYAQTIIGYDENGAKVLKLYPEGGELYE